MGHFGSGRVTAEIRILMSEFDAGLVTKAKRKF